MSGMCVHSSSGCLRACLCLLIQQANAIERSLRVLEAKITLEQVSLTEGTGRRGSEFWKLYSIGFLPENTFTNN